MTSTPTEWLGEDWEDYCLLLIRRRYTAEEVQRVPARHGGDLGIEAFTFTGVAFQCYANQGQPSTKDRYELQRDKLTTDLAKLESYQADLCTLLGGVVIRRYMFMVPVFDSAKIAQHAATKAEEYRTKKLSHLSDDFRIVVVTDDDFREERDQILEQQRELVPVEPPPVADVISWTGQNTELISTADKKLTIFLRDPGRRKRYLNTLIEQHLSGENTFSALRLKYPDQWETARRLINDKEQLLALEYLGQAGHAAQTVTQIARSLAEELRRESPVLSKRICQVIAWSAVADWLMRCPLDFYETASA